MMRTSAAGASSLALGLALAAVSACVPPPQAPPPPPPPPPQPIAYTPAPVDAPVDAGPAPTMVAQGPVSYMVAGCNVECRGCAALDAATFVLGTTPSHDGPLFAGPAHAGDTYSCSASVRSGEEVTLTASAGGGFDFVDWRPFFPGRDYCPCAGSHDPVCRVRLDPAALRGYQRVYCGAIWQPRGAAAQLAAP